MGRRLVAMADRLKAAGHAFFAAVGLHNASVAFLNAGDFELAIRTGTSALAAFAELPYPAPERSLHTPSWRRRLELGQPDMPRNTLPRPRRLEKSSLTLPRNSHWECSRRVTERQETSCWDAPPHSSGQG